MSKRKKSSIEAFIDLPDAQKQRIFDEIDSESPEESLLRSRPLNPREKRQWKRFQSKMGRPKIGKGSKTISLTVEKELLARADAYAKKHRISRARLVAKGLRVVLGLAA